MAAALSAAQAESAVREKEKKAERAAKEKVLCAAKAQQLVFVAHTEAHPLLLPLRALVAT